MITFKTFNIPFTENDTIELYHMYHKFIIYHRLTSTFKTSNIFSQIKNDTYLLYYMYHMNKHVS